MLFTALLLFFKFTFMYHKSSGINIVLLLGLLLLQFKAVKAQDSLSKQDSLKNLPEYSLPLTSRKLVIAHCMTNIIRYKGHEFEDSCNPKYYAPEGNISAPLGGLSQVKVMADSLLSTASLEEAVEFEMRAAIRSGIDGFQFYYVLGATQWDQIIKAYFKVAAEKKLDFKFALCISHPDGSTEALKVAEFASRINGLLDETGRNNPYWLRTPDGRLVVYQWLGESLADIPADHKGLPQEFYIARAYKHLADAVKERFACVFTINEDISPAKLNNMLDYFPATWIWTLPFDNREYIGYRIAETCRQRRRTFTGSVFNDFYTSKLLKKGTWNMFYKVQDAVAAGMDRVERKYITTGLSYNFRKLWEFGISQNVPVMNVITWNDYPEGHHLAPEINHNEGFSILLNYYKNQWKGLPSPYADRDVAIVFFKKYKHDIKPAPFNIPVVPFQKEVIAAGTEDSVEVVSLFRKPAVLKINTYQTTAAAGLVVSKTRIDKGAVTVSAYRNNQSVLHFTAPEEITDRPYRADRITYTFSSEFDRFYNGIFKGFKPIYSKEYRTAKPN